MSDFSEEQGLASLSAAGSVPFIEVEPKLEGTGHTYCSPLELSSTLTLADLREQLPVLSTGARGDAGRMRPASFSQHMAAGDADTDGAASYIFVCHELPVPRDEEARPAALSASRPAQRALLNATGQSRGTLSPR